MLENWLDSPGMDLKPWQRFKHLEVTQGFRDTSTERLQHVCGDTS